MGASFGTTAVRLAVVALAGAWLAACASIEPRYPSRGAATPPAGQGSYKVGKPYQVGGVWYVPREQPDYDETGVASWYGDAFHLKATANGELFDMNAVSAAHTTLPLPSIVEVTNLENGRRLQVRVNDRGPFVGDRIIDLSREGARQLGFERQGIARVRVRYVGPAPLLGRDAGVRLAAAPKVAPPPERAEVMEIAAGRALPAEPVAVQALPPPPQPVDQAGPVVAAAAPAALLRIQAGAFASEANAQRAAAQLAPAGRAVIEPVDREGVTLYRVLLDAPADEAEAYALRDRVAEFGFADARVVRAF